MKTATSGKIMTISMPASVDTVLGEQIIKDVQDWLLAPVDLYAFDFQSTTEVKQASYRPLLLMSQAIRKGGKKIVSYSLVELIDRQLKADGIAEALNVVENYNSFVAKIFPTKSNGIDVKVINPFLLATKKTLETQANTKCEPQKPVLVSVNDKSGAPDIAIAGVIALNTEGFSGTIALAFSETVFLKIYESMFGEKVEKITQESEDAAGELLNIIYGTAKTQLNAELGFKLAPALPTVLSGEKIKIRQTTFQKIILLPFMTPFGPFQVEISFDPVAS
jgi:chemotaxis protein CheX